MSVPSIIELYFLLVIIGRLLFEDNKTNPYKKFS